jgi:SAM-dependent methyltransferase
MVRLLDNSSLEQSPIVANSLMNRERGLVGSNSYTKELRFNPLTFLFEKLQQQPQVTWLDLCCGAGRALIEAAQAFHDAGLLTRVKLTGIDLAGLFHPIPACLNSLKLREASLAAWDEQSEYDLITCVHGLHYLGDKLEIIQRFAACLGKDGVFIAHLDSDNLKSLNGESAGKQIISELRKNGFSYDSRRRILRCQGARKIKLPYAYLGADDQAGSNYTGQAAVNSYYRQA